LKGTEGQADIKRSTAGEYDSQSELGVKNSDVVLYFRIELRATGNRDAPFGIIQ
jgi:hypothetical protein